MASCVCQAFTDSVPLHSSQEPELLLVLFLLRSEKLFSLRLVVILFPFCGGVSTSCPLAPVHVTLARSQNQLPALPSLEEEEDVAISGLGMQCWGFWFVLVFRFSFYLTLLLPLSLLTF